MGGLMRMIPPAEPTAPRSEAGQRADPKVKGHTKEKHSRFIKFKNLQTGGEILLGTRTIQTKGLKATSPQEELERNNRKLTRLIRDPRAFQTATAR